MMPTTVIAASSDSTTAKAKPRRAPIFKFFIVISSLGGRQSEAACCVTIVNRFESLGREIVTVAEKWALLAHRCASGSPATTSVSVNNFLDEVGIKDPAGVFFPGHAKILMEQAVLPCQTVVPARHIVVDLGDSGSAGQAKFNKALLNHIVFARPVLSVGQ
jgi:hypothetical protein